MEKPEDRESPESEAEVTQSDATELGEMQGEQKEVQSNQHNMQAKKREDDEVKVQVKKGPHKAIKDKEPLRLDENDAAVVEGNSNDELPKRSDSGQSSTEHQSVDRTKRTGSEEV